MSLIPGYPKGSDITLLNTAYSRKYRNDEGGIEKDYLTLIFRDNKTKEKKYHIIEEPEYTYYKTVDGLHMKNNLFFIEKDKVEPVTCKYSDILKSIAEVTGTLDTFYENIQSRNFSANRTLAFQNPDIFAADMDIEDHYRFLFGQEYTNTAFKLNIAYLDIETDNKDMVGDFPEMGECPINCISYLDNRTNTNYQLILDDGTNDQVAVFKNKMSQYGMMDNLKQFIINAVGGWKKAKKFGVYDLDYKFLFFKDEKELLKYLFKLIHATCPDMLLIWNMAFDLSYIIARIEKLGMDPLDVICDPRISKKFLKFYIDERNKNDYEERGDYVNCSMFTVWIDQMIHFASRRKGRGKTPGINKLDNVGATVAGVKKLDYSHITTNLSLLPYLDFTTFSWYNLMDTIVQKCIESKSDDCSYIFMKALVNNTRYNKVHRQSTYLANRFTKDFMGYGYIIGNNVNKWNEKPKEKYSGAMVHDVTHNTTYAMMQVMGRYVLIAANVIDFDYKSLYPSITLENNMAPNTQVGKIEISEQISYCEHRDMYRSDDEEENDSKYSRSGEFLENLMSDNILEFSKRWLHLGDVKDVLVDMIEYFEENKPFIPMNINYNDCVFESNGKPIECVEFLDYGNTINAVQFFNDWKNDYSYEDLKYRIEEHALL